MIEHNKRALEDYKRIFGLTLPQMAEIMGYAHQNSVIRHLNGSLVLNADHIARLCNESERMAQFNPALKPFIFTANSFFSFKR